MSRTRTWLIRLLPPILAAGVAVAIAVPVTSEVVSGRSDDKTTQAAERYKALENRYDVQVDLADEAETEADEMELRMSDTRDAMKRARNTLQARSDRLDKRETSIEDAEEIAAQSQFPGDGTFITGQDMLAGTYRTAGMTGCYYALMADTSMNAPIVNNNITDGPAIVTLSDGEVFETAGCDEWVKSD